jgi:hypothetical protein
MATGLPDILVTDQLDKPVENIKVDCTHPCSLLKYLRTELLHLAVVPDFLARKDGILSRVATNPIQFQAQAQQPFQLGNARPEINVTPGAQVTIRVNASAGANLFDGDPFPARATVPDRTAFVGVRFQGSLSLGISGSAGDLTFGLDESRTVTLEYLKAFVLSADEPTLGNALGQALSCYVIPTNLSDFSALGINDIATVSGQGSLTVGGTLEVTALPNPLASVNLPIGAGTIAIKAGPTAGLSADFMICGSYQLRALRKDADTIELSFVREKGTKLTADLSASAGISASRRQTDLIAAVLGAISTDPTGDTQLLADLRPEEIQTLSEAFKTGLDSSLQASLEAVLSTATEHQAAFQYEIQPARLSSEAAAAIQEALKGDLRRLTAMEANVATGGVLAPGVKMLNSVLMETRRRGVTLKINLLGILNYLTVSELIRNSEILTDAVTGDVTINETITGNRISAIVEPMARNEALRKTIFNSVLATTSYRAGKAVSMSGSSCEQTHFALNQNTNHQIMGDYLNWFIALKLLTPQVRTEILTHLVDNGPSTCVLRTSFTDNDCASIFFDKGGNLRPVEYYLEIGRNALRALLAPEHQPIDRIRSQILDDGLWPVAVRIGASSNLAPLVGLSTDDPRGQYLIGDVMVITDWARAMVQAGLLVQDMRGLVARADANTLFQNSEFKKKRDALQKKLSAIVKSSKTRFNEPWGMVCLFWAAGSPHTAYAKAVAPRLALERGVQLVSAAATS